MSRNCRLIDQILLQQLVVKAVKGKLQAVRDTELVIDFAQIVLNDLLSGTNLVSNFLVAHTARDATDNGQFFFRELGLNFGISEAGGLSAVGFDDPADGLVVD